MHRESPTPSFPPVPSPGSDPPARPPPLSPGRPPPALTTESARCGSVRREKALVSTFMVAQLKVCLRELRLPVGGNKANLAGRLQQALDGTATTYGGRMAPLDQAKVEGVVEAEAAKYGHRYSRSSPFLDQAMFDEMIRKESLKVRIVDPKVLQGTDQSGPMRCFCGQNYAQPNVGPTCSQCGCRQHLACMGLEMSGKNLKAPIVCEQCRARAVDPFWEPVPAASGGWNTPFRSAKLARQRQAYGPMVVSRVFELTRAQKTLLLSHPDKYQINVYCVQLQDEVPFRFLWPGHTQIHVNGTLHTNIKLGNYSKPGKRERDKPVNIAPLCKQGSNTVHVQGGEGSKAAYVVLVALAQKVPFERVRALAQRPQGGVADSLKRVEAIMKIGTDPDDEDVVSTSTIVPLKCPLSAMAIQVPARFTVCSHVKAFDLDTFLQMNAGTRKWQCPYCMKSSQPKDLQVDMYLKKVIDTVAKLEGEEITEVEVDPEAKWRPCRDGKPGGGKFFGIEEEVSADDLRQSLQKTEEDAATKKRVLGESSDEEELSEGAEMRAAAAAAAKLKRPKVHPQAVIELSDSEDEAPTSAPGAARARAPPSGGGGAAATLARRMQTVNAARIMTNMGAMPLRPGQSLQGNPIPPALVAYLGQHGLPVIEID